LEEAATHMVVNFDTLYVTNNDTVSVIDATTNTKITDIPVGDRATDLVLNRLTNDVYVLNRDSNNVTVISGNNYTKIKEIPVGEEPNDIAISDYTETVYITNSNSNSVSVINGTGNTKIKDIHVGDRPGEITISDDTETVYVTNRDSNSISVIDYVENKVVAGIEFYINPIMSGYIECGEYNPPISQFFYVWSGTKCTAIPNSGFEFLSWEKNLGGGSTQLINFSNSASPFETILDIFGMKSKEPESTLNITKFGSFTANFKELPHPMPAEYWATLFGFVLTTGLGVWLIPSFVRWTSTKADTRKSNYYHQRIKSLYDDGSLDENDIKELDRLKTDVTDAHSKGKVNELHYNSLKNEISMLYEEIFRKGIESISNSPKNDSSKEQINKLKNDIEIAYSKEKIRELHYNLLNKKIQAHSNNSDKS
jgi:YVTN family beta-propeller protein